MPNFRDDLPHLFVKNSFRQSQEYRSPRSLPRPRFPERNREEHANHLLRQLDYIKNETIDGRSEIPISAPAPEGVYLEFESEPGFELTLKSLDLKSKGIELLNVTDIKIKERYITKAIVFVPDDSFTVFVQKLNDYRDEQTKTGNPKNKALVDSISNIKKALIRSIWTDSPDVFPKPKNMIWWEVWLRSKSEAIPRFQTYCQSRSIHVGHRILHFPDRYVMLIYASLEQLEELIDSMDYLAELRLAKEVTADFMELSQTEQMEWTEAFLDLLDHPQKTDSRVCILDTGVNRQHPLISPFLANTDMHSCNPDWRTNDHHGHGTKMAGTTLFGNLANQLMSTDRVQIYSHLESVKIIPPDDGNTPELYGNLTIEAISRAEINNPKINRAICMAVTSTDSRDRGQPSSWSAAIDKSVSGMEDKKRRLMFISGGNIFGDAIEYPAVNETESIHDPGQAWNAITVGAFTELDFITEKNLQDWTPIAPAGDMAPTSTTSLLWSKKWPIKPEIVLEGGNMAISPDGKMASFTDSLSLLTTNKNFNERIFTVNRETSAATGMASRFASIIQHKYHQLWPETVRALLIHTAEWTQAMTDRYSIENKTQREALLRRCGYGVPNLEKALNSASNSLTLIIEDEIHPFEKKKMKEIHFYNLPWPKQVLEDLDETEVQMKVTLSYFVEPNPGRRGWTHKHRYQSAGLRFDVKTPTESIGEFQIRTNKALRDPEKNTNVTSSGDSNKWYFGKNIRSRGSIHHDIWKGSAIELSQIGTIGIFPIVGWWRERYTEGHTEKNIKYSLVVSIHTPEIEHDIYTPVKNIIEQSIDTEIAT